MDENDHTVADEPDADEILGPLTRKELKAFQRTADRRVALEKTQRALITQLFDEAKEVAAEDRRNWETLAGRLGLDMSVEAKLRVRETPDGAIAVRQRLPRVH